MSRRNIKRSYFHYEKLEEFKSNMWKTITGSLRINLIDKAYIFTSNTELYGFWLMQVLDQWPYSCIHNLSATEINRQAWIGHAACALAMGIPEDLTRCAWHLLTEKQQNDANAKADQAILKWEKVYFRGDSCLSNTQQLTFFRQLGIE